MRLVLAVTAFCALSAQGQPIECEKDEQCASGFYCLIDVYACRECLHCEDLHREPPRATASCVRSVAECGPCLKGYVDDRLGMGSGCTEEGAGEVPWYLWLIVVLAIVCCFAVAVIIYVLRNTDSFKVFASTRTSVEAPVGAKAEAPSAPRPPPYNYGAPAIVPYELRPASLDSGAAVPPYDEDSAQPLVKRVPSMRGGAVRESAGSQNAVVYTNPNYVRNVPPPSYESATSDDEHEAPFVPVDEDTVESVWTPDTNPHTDSAGESAGAATGGAVGGASGESSGATAAAALALRRPSRSDIVSPSPAKMRCIEDSNNNSRSGDGSESRGPHPASPPPAPAPAPSVVINVLNVNSVRQINDVTL